ncbi:hypothetical protein GCM10029978_046730 [Actinoallomurus acanthiterrae]
MKTGAHRATQPGRHRRLLRVPVAVLQVTRVLPADTPTWYLLFQGFIGVLQFGISVPMLAGDHRAGVGGRF